MRTRPKKLYGTEIIGDATDVTEEKDMTQIIQERRKGKGLTMVIINFMTSK